MKRNSLRKVDIPCYLVSYLDTHSFVIKYNVWCSFADFVITDSLLLYLYPLRTGSRTIISCLNWDKKGWRPKYYYSIKYFMFQHRYFSISTYIGRSSVGSIAYCHSIHSTWPKKEGPMTSQTRVGDRLNKREPTAQQKKNGWKLAR